MICHPCKCIFVHIPRTGGQSVESVFVDYVGLSWETRAPLLLRANDHPELGPPVLAHLTASEYLQYVHVSKQLFDDYFKFSFVRDPWDRVVSFYRYFGYHHRYDFNHFVKKILRGVLWQERYYFVRPQFEFLYNIDGSCLVNFVGRFETIDHDFNFVRGELGLPQVVLPHKNKSNYDPIAAPRGLRNIWMKLHENLFNKNNPIPANYREYFNEETIEIVRSLYSRDISLFGYAFNQT
jgi:hypothetical protein